MQTPEAKAERGRGHIGGVDPNSIFLGLPLYRSQGFFLNQRDMYDKALARFKEALFINQNDSATLIGKITAEIMTQKYDEALADAEKVLALDPSHLGAFYRKALSMHLMSEFEQALMFHHRGLERRKKPPIFDEGVIGCQEVIEDCIGRNVGQVLLDNLDVIKAMEEDRKMRARFEMLKVTRKCSDEQPEMPKTTISARQEWMNRRMEQCSWVRYLNFHFAQDYYFCDGLRKHPDVLSLHQGHSQQIYKIADDCCNNLFKTKSTLRDRKPYYAYTYTDITLKAALKKRKQIAWRKEMKVAKQTTEAFFSKLESFKGNTKESLVVALRAKEYFDHTPPSLLPEMNEHQERLYDIVADTYLDVLMLHPGSDVERQIRQYLGLSVLGRESVDDLVKTAYHPHIDSKSVIDENLKKLKHAAHDLEYAWLYHDLALSHFVINQKLDVARGYAKKALTHGRSAENGKWQLLARMLSLKLEYKSGNNLEARNAAQEAIETARELGIPQVVEFIDACVLFLEMNKGETSDAIQERAQQILHLLATDQMKQEAAGIFRHIASQPVKRRMSLVPGMKHTKKSLAFAGSRRRSSVDPGTTEDVNAALEASVSKKASGESIKQAMFMVPAETKEKPVARFKDS